MALVKTSKPQHPRTLELLHRFQYEDPILAYPDGALHGTSILLRKGCSVMHLFARRGFCVKEGIVHGGILFALADTAGVYAAMSVVPDGHTPLKTGPPNHLRPVFEGETMRAVAKVTARTRGSVVVDVRLYGSKNRKVRVLYRLEFKKPAPK